MKNILLILGIIFIFSCASQSTSSTALRRDFEVQGHRGARAVLAENTIPAFDLALRAGAEVLELDLHVTADDKLVLAHDPRVNADLCLDSKGKRLTNPPLIRELSLSEVQEYDCGSLKNPRFPRQKPRVGEKMPAFEDFLVWLQKHPDPRARTVRLNVETKIEPEHPEHAPAPESFARLVLRALHKHGMIERTVLQSFDFRTLVAARAINSEIRLAALVEHRPKADLVRLVREVDAAILSPHHEWITAADVEALHRASVQVIPWTANDADVWKRLAEIGVDGIITDDPEALLEWRSRL